MSMESNTNIYLNYQANQDSVAGGVNILSFLIMAVIFVVSFAFLVLFRRDIIARVYKNLTEAFTESWRDGRKKLGFFGFYLNLTGLIIEGLFKLSLFGGIVFFLFVILRRFVEVNL